MTSLGEQIFFPTFISRQTAILTICPLQTATTLQIDLIYRFRGNFARKSPTN